MLEELKEKVFRSNLDLVRYGLVVFTWGNVSGRDYKTGLIVIKPSGVSYDKMKAEDMVVVDINGKVVDGNLRPSADMATHLELYKNYPDIGGITHTHSTNAVAFAQAGRDIPALGTTHADYFYGDIPCTRSLTKEEVETAYEKNTGKVIIEEIKKRGYDPKFIPGIIVRNHGPFSWGNDCNASVFNSVVMEMVAEMDLKTLLINKNPYFDDYILDKHFQRKHGPNAYYGQDEIK